MLSACCRDRLEHCSIPGGASPRKRGDSAVLSSHDSCPGEKQGCSLGLLQKAKASSRAAWTNHSVQAHCEAIQILSWTRDWIEQIGPYRDPLSFFFLKYLSRNIKITRFMTCSTSSKSDGAAFGAVNLSAWYCSAAASGVVHIPHDDTSPAASHWCMAGACYLSADRSVEEYSPSWFLILLIKIK